MADPIREDDLVASIADALQYIAVYHPPSFVKALAESYAREESPAARDAIGQILVNSRMAAFGRRPMGQDTGTVNVFVKLGMGARIASTRPLEELVNVAGSTSPTPTPTTRCAPRSSATRYSTGGARATTPRRWCTARACPATP